MNQFAELKNDLGKTGENDVKHSTNILHPLGKQITQVIYGRTISILDHLT